MDETKRLIGICGVRIFEQNVMSFIKILQEEAKKQGFQLIFFAGSSCNQEETDEIIGQYKLIELMEYVELSAVVILTETLKNKTMIQKLLQLGREKNIPVFSLDRKAAGGYCLLTESGHCFEQIVRHVVEEHGCRYVNMILEDKGHSFTEECIAVYRKVLKENGIPFEAERVRYGNDRERPAARVVERMLESDFPFPEAIVCVSDIMAYAAISALNEHGYEVPEDIIVTGYDGTEDKNIFIPSLTTGVANVESLVQFMIEKIKECIEDKVVQPCDKIAPVVVKLRQSCGCEPKIIPKNDRRIAMLLDEISNGKWHMKSLKLLLDDSFGKKKLDEVFALVQKHMDVFFNFCRYICINSEFLHSYEPSEACTDVTNMLEADFGKFGEPGKSWNIKEMQEQIVHIINKEEVEIIQVHLLNSGRQVFGFVIEGLEELAEWQLRHCDEFVMILAHIIQTVVYNFKMEEMNKKLLQVNQEIEAMSLCDPMTGIYNRRGLFWQVQKIVSEPTNEGKYLYLFFIDMDGLKFINDHFGHKEGDFALETLAKVLIQMSGKENVCARIGGDEFVCAVVEETVRDYTSNQFGERMEALLQKAQAAAAKPYPLTASVGMVSEAISDSLDIDAMMNCADNKMYRHKAARKRKRNG